ncbi:hypothetical protein SPFM8_00217 [Salmonella phage SPFM8]|nr:hypothetical protein SPFM8_00217 [Salmonella phage SPFM8]
MNYPATVLDWQKFRAAFPSKNINGYVYNAIPGGYRFWEGQEVKEEMFYMEPPLSMDSPIPRDKAIYIPDGNQKYLKNDTDWMVLDQYGRFVPPTGGIIFCLRNMKMINEKLKKSWRSSVGNSGRSSIDNLIKPQNVRLSWGRKAHYRSRTGVKTESCFAKWKITKQ